MVEKKAVSSWRFVVYILTALCLGGLAAGAGMMISAQKQIVIAGSLITSIERYVSSLKDVETSYRGFVITGLESYLQPFEDASADFAENGERLRLLANELGNRRLDVNPLLTSAAEKYRFASSIITVRRDAGLEGAAERMKSGTGKRLMDRVRSQAEIMQAQLHDIADHRYAARMRQGSWLLGLSLIGLCLAAVYFIRDSIKNRQRANQDQNLLIEILKRIPVGIALIDRNSRVAMANSAFDALHGGDASPGKPLRDISPVLAQALGMSVRSILDRGADARQFGGKALSLGRGEDGLPFVDATAFPVALAARAGGDERGVGLVLVDVSERLAWERDLEATRDEAAAANRAKSAFIANMSHELRTPLTAVLGYSELLAEELEDLGHAELLKDLEKINVNARHLLGLINDVLDLSKIEAQKMDIHPVEIALSTLLSEVEASASVLVAKNDNQFIIERPEDEVMLFVDDLKLKQILINLIGNAAKFTSNGVITLKATLPPGDAFRQRLRIEVRDTGIGMTPDQLANLFQRFRQADETTTRKFGGTGLGLALTKALSAMLGGTIEATSEVDAGSTFALTIPLRYEPTLVEPAAPGSSHDSDGGTAGPVVLIVDDDPYARELLSRILSKEGFSIVSAPDGETAIEKAKRVHPVAILLDVMMPGMDGWHVLQALKADPLTADIPVIIQTVLEDSQFAFASGASGFLKKPIDRDRLTSALTNLPPGASSGYALMIDDDPDAIQRISEFLAKDGWKVKSCAQGAEALAMMHQSPPALVLVDLVMPQMDGYAFIRHMRDNPRWNDIPIVVLTAEDVMDQKVRDLASQTADIVQKGSRSLTDLVQDLRKYAQPSPPSSVAQGRPADPAV